MQDFPEKLIECIQHMKADLSEATGREPNTAILGMDVLRDLVDQGVTPRHGMIPGLEEPGLYWGTALGVKIYSYYEHYKGRVVENREFRGHVEAEAPIGPTGVYETTTRTSGPLGEHQVAKTWTNAIHNELIRNGWTVLHADIQVRYATETEDNPWTPWVVYSGVRFSRPDDTNTGEHFSIDQLADSGALPAEDLD